MRLHSFRIAEVVNRCAQTVSSGGVGHNKQNQPQSRQLALETLESRELLSVSPWLGDDTSTVQTGQVAETIEPIALSDANLDFTANAEDAPLSSSDAMPISAAVGEQEARSTFVTSIADTVDAYDGVVTLREAIEVYSGGSGTITFDESLRGKTIALSGRQINISGAITIDASSLYDSVTSTPGITIGGNDASRLFEVFNGNTLNLIGLTLTGGAGVSGDAYSRARTGEGGAIYSAAQTTVRIVDSIFHDNHAQASGGAIHASSNTILTVDNSLFYDNTAVRNGGAVYASDVVELTTIVNSKFHNNVADKGGALYLYGATNVTINNVDFYENTAVNGGAIFNDYSTVHIESSNFHDNAATATFGFGACSGGAIHHDGGTLDVETSNFCHNTSMYSGGSIYLHAGDSAAIEESSFNLNAAVYGGAIYADTPDLKIWSASLYENEATRGAAILAENVDLALQNVLIHSNRVTEVGAAIYADNAYVETHNVTIANNGLRDSAGGGVANNSGAFYFNGTSSSRLYNTIVAKNTAGDIGMSSTSSIRIFPFYVLSSFTGWSDAGNPYVVMEYNDALPLFVDALNNDYRLAANSQAINQGYNKEAAGGDVNGVYDLAGAMRIQEGTVDLGAFEYDPSAIPEYHFSISSHNKTSFKWDAIEGASTYTLQYSEDNGTTWTDYALDITETSVASDNLEAGKTYVFKIEGFDGEGTSVGSHNSDSYAPIALETSASSYTFGDTITTTLTSANPNNVNIKWYYGDEEIVSAENTLSFTPPGNEYDVRIVATGSGSSTGSIASATVARPMFVGTVTASSYNASAGQATIAWTPVANAASYTLQKSSDGGETWEVVAENIAGVNKSVGNLLAGQTYDFLVAAFDAQGNILNSYDAGSFAPFSLEASETAFSDGDAVSFVLHASSEASINFNWYYLASDGTITEINVGGSMFSYVPENPLGDIVVVATGTDLSEGSATRLTFSYTPPVTVGTVALAEYDAAQNLATVEWTAITNAASYALQFSRDGGVHWNNYATGLTDVTTTIRNVYVGQSYDFRVQAFDAAGRKLASYNEGTFAPAKLSSKSNVYLTNVRIDATLNGAKNASADVRWYAITPAGDVEIESARGKLYYTPTVATYDLKVVATGTGPSQGYSSEQIFTSSVAVGAVNVDSYDSTSTQAVLSWDEIADAATYMLQISRDGGANWETYSSSLNTTRKFVSELKIGKSYNLRVYGVSSDGALLETFNEGVFSPVGLESSSNSYSAGKTIELSQQGASNASADYRWYYVAEEGDVEISEAANQLSYTPLTNAYDIKVVATGTHASEGSSYVRVFRSPVTIGKTEVAGYDPATGTIELTWNKIALAKTYTVQYSVNDGIDWISYPGAVSEEKMTLTGLEASETWQFRIRGAMSGGAVLGSFDTGTFTPVKIDSATNSYVPGSSISVNITTGSADTRWYYVTQGGDVEIKEAAGLLEYEPTEIRFDVKVVATGSGASRGSTAELEFAPALKIDYDASTRGATLSWDAVENAVRYSVQISKNGGQSWANYRTGLTDASCVVAGLYTGSAYGFRIYGYTANGIRLDDKVVETTFAPLAVTSSVDNYYVGEAIALTPRVATADAVHYVKWFYVTKNGDVEIPKAENQLAFIPESSDYDVKAVVIGTGAASGSVAETTIFRGITLENYDSSTRLATLSWGYIPNAETYTVKVPKTDADGVVTWINKARGLSETTYDVSGLYAGKSYQYRVYGVTSGGVTLDDYREVTFAPITTATTANAFVPGDVITISLTKVANSKASVVPRWYAVTENGDVEIVEAAGLLQYAPTVESDVKVVVTGTGYSRGSTSTLTIPYNDATSLEVVSYAPSTGKLTLSWGDMAGAVKYNVKVSTDGGETFTKVANKVTSPKLVSNIFAGQEYVIQITGVDSHSRVLKTQRELAFAPINLTASSEFYTLGDVLAVTLEGSENSSAAINWYYVTEEGDVEITEASGLLEFEPADASYDIKVVATGTGLSTGAAPTVTFTRSGSGIVYEGYNESTRKPTISWDSIPLATSYTIKITRDGGETWLTYLKGIEGLSAEVNAVNLGSSCSYRICGVSAGGAMLRGYHEGTITPLSLTANQTNFMTGDVVSVTLTGADTTTASVKWYYVTETGDVEIGEAAGLLEYRLQNEDYNVRVVATRTDGALGSACVVVASAYPLIPPSASSGYGPTMLPAAIPNVEPQDVSTYATNTIGPAEVADEELVVFAAQTETEADEHEISGAELVVTDYDALTRQATVQWGAIADASSYVLYVSKNGGLSWTEHASGLTGCMRIVNDVDYDRSVKFRVFGVASDGTLLENYYEGALAPVKLVAKTDSYAPGETLTVRLLGYADSSAEIRWYYTTPEGDSEIVAARNMLSHRSTTADYDVKVVATGVGRSEGSSSTCLFTHLVEETPSTVVTSLEDVIDEYDGVITLREAIEVYSEDGSVITFASDLAGQTVALNGELVISKNLSIDASSLYNVVNSEPGLTIEGSGNARVLTINRGSLELNAVTLTGGSAKDGGAIYVSGAKLSVRNSVVRGNEARTNGGAIYASNSIMTLVNTSITDNTATFGGAIFTYNTYATIERSEIGQNQAQTRSGAIELFANSSLTLESSKIFENVAGTGGGA
ncbi:MAG: fibronectin type III domain-containing protein, partial [Thermoguttaceae bacterium]|nr:fibronectin type III domain-containing protein [Thermoguttaceae bacterium]